MLRTTRRKNRRRIDRAEVRAAAASFSMRAARVLGTLAFFLGVAGVVALCSSKGREWLRTSRTFAIEKISFEGARHADEAELARLSGISLGDNIFDADVLAAERSIAGNPWIKRVTVERDYPRTLVVRLVEHEPAALADLGGLYYVDEQGKAFKKLGPGEEADMPILRGVSREDHAAQGDETEALFREAIGVLAAWREAGLEKRAPVSEVVVDRVEGMTVFCGREPVAVKLGVGEVPEKLGRLDQLLTELQRRGARAEVVRLDNRARPGWVAVQLAQASGGLQ